MAKQLYVLVSDARPCTPQIVLYREQEVLDCDCDMASVIGLGPSLSGYLDPLTLETLVEEEGMM